MYVNSYNCIPYGCIFADIVTPLNKYCTIEFFVACICESNLQLKTVDHDPDTKNFTIINSYKIDLPLNFYSSLVIVNAIIHATDIVQTDPKLCLCSQLYHKYYSLFRYCSNIQMT